ncbi:MAG TPA: acetyl-CoA C-acyltransferase [Bacteroidia bacterium]|nr:acetyl-CoA C-acyltransferase [Bacteroidia bacterium]
MKEVFIVAAKRTPIGGFMGKLSSLSASELGASIIEGTYQSIKLNPSAIDSVYMGNVLSANLGQSPARQASIFAGLNNDIDCTTINKVCASGMKAITIGAQQIQLGLENLVVAGGMESMSNVPHYVKMRLGNKLGQGTMIDGLLKDGLSDVYHQISMGQIAELSAKKYHISREEQDNFALNSYAKAANATKSGKFNNEAHPITLSTKDGEIEIIEDEDIFKIIPEKVSKLKPSFDPNGTITAANASNINDGAAVIILASKEAVEKYKLKALAKIIGYADAAQAPEDYATSPSKAIPKALLQAKLHLNEIDFIEINEAFSVVVLANQKILGFNLAKTNIYGGAVAIGHPLGTSGARIVVTLLSVLQQEGGKYGLAAICNGGGAATAMIIENLNH